MKNLIVPKHFTLQWHITERCNWRCKHCYQEWDKMPPDLSLNQLFYIFDKFLFLIKKWQLPPWAVNLNITGGEPMIRKDFYQFVEKLGRYSHLYRWGLLSNGSLLNREIALKLKKANLSKCQVSLEGMEKNNDEIRGKESFKKTVEAIKLLVHFGLPATVSLTLTKKNMNDVADLAKLCEKLGVHALSARRLIPWGKGKEMEEYMLQPQELKDFYFKVKEINKKISKKRGIFRVVIGCESGIFNDELLANPLGNMQPNICGVTQGRILTIMANADIFPCRRLPIVIGNAIKESIYDVFNSQKMQEIRDMDKIHPFCQKCANFINCFGGAKCVNFAYTGNWNIPDVQCWKAYKKLDQPIF